MNEDLKKYLEDYDSGQVVESIEMGGISQDYEIAIQHLVVETLKILLLEPVSAKVKDYSKKVIDTINIALALPELNYGYSAAQVGAARNLAGNFWYRGPSTVLAELKSRKKERIIKIQKIENNLKIIK